MWILIFTLMCNPIEMPMGTLPITEVGTNQNLPSLINRSPSFNLPKIEKYEIKDYTNVMRAI